MTDWRPLVAETCARLWPDWPDATRWIAAQVQVESSGDPRAVSPAGAQGLLQLMPATWTELGPGGDPFDPAENLRRGVTYLRQQYDRLGQISSHDDRVLWSFAAYTGGRGYVVRALTLARLEEPALWWTWREGRRWLMHRACRLAEGRYPDHLAIWAYVDRIVGHARGGL